jgi:hypothetical protein
MAVPMVVIMSLAVLVAVVENVSMEIAVGF